LTPDLPPLERIVAQLEGTYGPPEALPVTGPWELILWENVAYLVDDARRQEVFRALESRIGTAPEKILAAPLESLVEVVDGLMPGICAQKLRRAAATALAEPGGSLDYLAGESLPAARRALKKYPGIGDPGADKILLFSGSHPVLALDSNGLRVLVRLGFAQEGANYAATYRAAQEAVADEVELECAWLIRAHQLLRRHGQELCRRSGPRCEICPLAGDCRYRQRLALYSM
jgi:endonuclease-3